MNTYEAMILIRPDLSEEEKKTLFDKIQQAITSKDGRLIEANIWAGKRKLAFDIKSMLTSGGTRRNKEALFYLVNFQINSESLRQLRDEFKLNDSIIRVLIIKGK